MCHCLFLLPLTHTHSHTPPSFLLPSLPLSHQAATVPLLIASRGTQIYSLYRLKSVGDVSISMFVLSSYASAGKTSSVAPLRNVFVCELIQFCCFSLSTLQANPLNFSLCTLARLFTIAVEVKDLQSKL